MMVSEHNNFGVDFSGVVHLPGLPPLHVSDFPPVFMGSMPSLESVRKEERAQIKAGDGILINSVEELEAEAIDTLRKRLGDVPVLPIGPLAQGLKNNVCLEGLELSDEAVVLSWLDKQAPMSVVYVGFGTTGMLKLKERHVLELANGLEASQHSFVWVLRAPHNYGKHVDELLPPGFAERINGRGLLLRGWAPQLKILEHPSTGAFMTACGWNSAMESLARGVPIIGWPSFADQGLNCSILVAKGFGIRLELQNDHFVEAEEIAKAVRLMLRSEEGHVMRVNAKKFSAVAGAARRPGGSSNRNFEKFAELVVEGIRRVSQS